MKEVSPLLMIIEARRRNKFLEPLLQTPDGIYLPRIKSRLAQFKKIASISFPRIKIHGRENAERAVDLIRSGQKLKIAPHHSSHADGAGIRAALERINCGVLVDDGVFAAGVKMFENPFTAHLVRAENLAIVIPPQQLAQAAERRAELSSSAGLAAEEEIEEVDKYIRNSKEANNRSRVFLENKAAQGHPTLIYLESTRSPDRYLSPAPRDVGVFLRDGYVMPVSMLGINRKYPPNSFINLRHILNLSEIEIFFGKPFEAQEAWDTARRFFGRGKNSNPAEVVMAKIAQLTPELIPATKAAYYRAILSS